MNRTELAEVGLKSQNHGADFSPVSCPPRRPMFFTCHLQVALRVVFREGFGDQSLVWGRNAMM